MRARPLKVGKTSEAPQDFRSRINRVVTVSGGGFFLAGICLFKVNSGNIRTISEICSKLTIKKPEKRKVILVSFC